MSSTSFQLAGYEFERDDARLVLRPGRGYARYLSCTGGCIVAFVVPLVLLILAGLVGDRAAGIVLIVGFLALLLLAWAALRQQKRQVAEPVILDRRTGRYLHGQRIICPLSQIEWIALEFDNQGGGKVVYPVLWDGCSAAEIGRPLVSWEQEQRFAREIADFLGVEMRIVGGNYRSRGGGFQ